MTTTETEEALELLSYFKVRDMEYNKLSQKTRVALEELVPKEGQVFIRRTESPFIVTDMQQTDSTGRPTGMKYAAQMYGELRIPCEYSIQDPHTGVITKIFNLRQFDGSGLPEPVEAKFNKNNPLLMLDMSNALERQTLCMLYLDPMFEQTILKNRNGNTVKYERVDQVKMLGNEVDARYQVAEMIVKLKGMDIEEKRLLAQTCGFDPKGNVLGDSYIEGFLQNCIDQDPQKLDSGMKILNVVRTENLIRKACEYGLLLYNIAESCFSYNNSKAQVMVFFAKNEDNQYRHAANTLLDGNIENKAHLDFLTDLVAKHEEKLRSKIQNVVEGVLAPGEIKKQTLEDVAEKYEKRMANKMTDEAKKKLAESENEG